jgi:hypothetical protein
VRSEPLREEEPSGTPCRSLFRWQLGSAQSSASGSLMRPVPQAVHNQGPSEAVRSSWRPRSILGCERAPAGPKHLAGPASCKKLGSLTNTHVRWGSLFISTRQSALSVLDSIEGGGSQCEREGLRCAAPGVDMERRGLVEGLGHAHGLTDLVGEVGTCITLGSRGHRVTA